MLCGSSVVLVCPLRRCACAAQTLTQRGLRRGQPSVSFRRRRPTIRRSVVGDFLAREELFVKPAPWMQFAGGLDLRANSHDQVEDRWRLDLDDRGVQRPRLSLRRLTATLTPRPAHRRRRQAVHPLGQGRHHQPHRSLCAARLHQRRRHRVPRGDRRARAWRSTARDVRGGVGAALHAEPRAAARSALDRRPAGGGRSCRSSMPGRRFPDRIADRPALGTRGRRIRILAVVLQRLQSPAERRAGWGRSGRWAQSRSGGQAASIVVAHLSRDSHLRRRRRRADAVVHDQGRGGVLHVSRRTPAPPPDEYVLYVVQLERQTGEWVIVAGYAGEAVTTQRRRHLAFAPDRGLTRSIVGARVVHDRPGAQHRVRDRHPPERRRRLRQGRVLAGARRALARDVHRRRHRRPERRLPRPVPSQLSRCRLRFAIVSRWNRFSCPPTTRVR